MQLWWSVIFATILSQGKAVSTEVSFQNASRAFWAKDGSIYAQGPQGVFHIAVGGNKNKITTTSKDTLIGINGDVLLFHDQKASVVYGWRDKRVALDQHLPPGTDSILQFDHATKTLCCIVKTDTPEETSYSMVVVKGEKILYQSQSREYIWDARYQAGTGFLYFSSRGFGLAGTSFGTVVERIRNSDKVTLWNPVDLTISNRSCFPHIYPPSRTAFVGQSQVLRFLIVPGANFDKVRILEGFHESSLVWGRIIGPRSLRETTLEVWLANMDFFPLKLQVKVPSEFPPHWIDYEEKSNQVLMVFSSKIITFTLR